MIYFPVCWWPSNPQILPWPNLPVPWDKAGTNKYNTKFCLKITIFTLCYTWHFHHMLPYYLRANNHYLIIISPSVCHSWLQSPLSFSGIFHSRVNADKPPAFLHHSCVMPQVCHFCAESKHVLKPQQFMCLVTQSSCLASPVLTYLLHVWEDIMTRWGSMMILLLVLFLLWFSLMLSYNDTSLLISPAVENLIGVS